MLHLLLAEHFDATRHTTVPTRCGLYVDRAETRARLDDGVDCPRCQALEAGDEAQLRLLLDDVDTEPEVERRLRLVEQAVVDLRRQLNDLRESTGEALALVDDRIDRGRHR